MLYNLSERQHLSKHNILGSIVGEHLAFRLHGENGQWDWLQVFLSGQQQMHFCLTWLKSLFLCLLSGGQQHISHQKVYGAAAELRNIADKLITLSLEDQTRGRSTAELTWWVVPTESVFWDSFHTSKCKNLKQWWKRLGFLFWLNQLTWKGMSVKSGK